MRQNFATALAFTLEYEGGFANDPADPGGRTMRGITQRTYSAWLKSQGLPNADVATIPATSVRAIYHDNYWDAIGGDAIAGGLDLALFDYAVNSGTGKANNLKAQLGYKGGSVAGKINIACNQRLSFMHRLAKLWVRFGVGWTRRVKACNVASLKLAGTK